MHFLTDNKRTHVFAFFPKPHVTYVTVETQEKISTSFEYTKVDGKIYSNEDKLFLTTNQKAPPVHDCVVAVGRPCSLQE